MATKEVSIDDVDDAFESLRLKWLDMSGVGFDRSHLQHMKKQAASGIGKLNNLISKWEPYVVEG